MSESLSALIMQCFVFLCQTKRSEAMLDKNKCDHKWVVSHAVWILRGTLFTSLPILECSKYRTEFSQQIKHLDGVLLIYIQ